MKHIFPGVYISLSVAALGDLCDPVTPSHHLCIPFPFPAFFSPQSITIWHIMYVYLLSVFPARMQCPKGHI